MVTFMFILIILMMCVVMVTIVIKAFFTVYGYAKACLEYRI